MKKLYVFTFALSFFICFSVFSQDTKYYVIKVQGEIIKAIDNKPLRSGLTIKEDDNFIFRSNLSRAAVINPEKGQFVLTPPDKNATASNKAHFMPPMQNISSRAGVAILNLIDFQNHFKNNYLIINKVKICIDSNNFPMNANNFFFINYDYNGESINKKLISVNDTLIISKKEIFTIDGQPQNNPEKVVFKLFYMSGEQANLMSEFITILPDEEKLTEELLNIKQVFNDETDFEKQALNFITTFYGNPQEGDFKNYINSIK